ncbi:MAG: hypothetical protein JWM80_5888 [Cyanobacteria bacterium RYN_339]|nr:hypothetical protein [Cyanobacteria bacterium RYN_339]
MPRHLLIASLALATACAPLDARVAPVAKPSKEVPAAAVATVGTVATAPPGVLGKMKEPVGLVRQSAFIQSLNDALPVSLVSGGLGALGGASSVLANNGGNLISNNGGTIISEKGVGVISDSGSSWHVLQAAASPVPLEGVNVRPEGVYHTIFESGGLAATLEIYDVKLFDQKKPVKDNQAALMDRFHTQLVDITDLGNHRYAVETALTVLSSKRLPFVKALNVIQTGSSTAGLFQNEKYEYILPFDVQQADGETDHADLHLTSEGADLVRAKDLSGAEIPGTEAPGRMVLTGSNARGVYAGAVDFLPGGNIQASYTHTRKDGTKTQAGFTLASDGSSVQTSSSEAGKLSLTARHAIDGKVTLEVRTLTGATPELLPSEVASDAGGIATFDFGETQKSKARLY